MSVNSLVSNICILYTKYALKIEKNVDFSIAGLCSSEGILFQ